MMLETASDTKDLAAVVSEGAGARVLSEEMDQDLPGADKVLGLPLGWVKQTSVAVFSNQSPPTNLKVLVPKIAPRPLLLIAAPNSPNGEDLNRGYYKAAGQPKTRWEIPESGHVDGLAARPAEYERRVVAFFDHALPRRWQGSSIARTANLPPSVPRQFVGRAAAVVIGLTMLLVVNVRGVAFYVAWTLVGLAFLTEAAATYVYWRRARVARRRAP